MRRGFYQLTALMLCSAPLMAQEAVDLTWFEQYVAGKTLHFQRNGQYHGAEQFLDNRRVIWQFSGGACIAGRYTLKEGAMCFSYDIAPDDIQCWQMLEDADGIFARNVDADANADNSANDLRITWQTPLPLKCGEATGGA